MDITAELPGRVMEVAVQPGQTVRKGDVLMALEVMKTRVEVRAAHDGRVNHVAVKESDEVRMGTLLVRLAP